LSLFSRFFISYYFKKDPSETFNEREKRVDSLFSDYVAKMAELEEIDHQLSKLPERKAPSKRVETKYVKISQHPTIEKVVYEPLPPLEQPQSEPSSALEEKKEEGEEEKKEGEEKEGEKKEGEETKEGEDKAKEGEDKDKEGADLKEGEKKEKPAGEEAKTAGEGEKGEKEGEGKEGEKPEGKGDKPKRAKVFLSYPILSFSNRFFD